MQTNVTNPRRLRSNQSGFTLVEIAIVLVIIGLLLGGVLKGQELIENGRIKAAANDMNGMLAAHNSYFDRFHRLPGDDGPLATITGRGGKWNVANMSGGNTDGTINATAPNTLTGGDAEAVGYFQHLRAAGFINGDPNLNGLPALPANAWGGLTGIANAAVQGRAQAQIVICMGNVPGKSARALDVQFDDGAIGRGTFRATIGGANLAPAATADAAEYTDDATYTVCRDIT